jgi:hypothetical protein
MDRCADIAIDAGERKGRRALGKRDERARHQLLMREVRLELAQAQHPLGERLIDVRVAQLGRAGADLGAEHVVDRRERVTGDHESSTRQHEVLIDVVVGVGELVPAHHPAADADAECFVASLDVESAVVSGDRDCIAREARGR